MPDELDCGKESLETDVAGTDRSSPSVAGPEKANGGVSEDPDGDDGIGRFPWH